MGGGDHTLDHLFIGLYDTGGPPSLRFGSDLRAVPIDGTGSRLRRAMVSPFLFTYEYKP